LDLPKARKSPNGETLSNQFTLPSALKLKIILFTLRNAASKPVNPFELQTEKRLNRLIL